MQWKPRDPTGLIDSATVLVSDHQSNSHLERNVLLQYDGLCSPICNPHEVSLVVLQIGHRGLGSGCDVTDHKVMCVSPAIWTAETAVHTPIDPNEQVSALRSVWSS